MGVHFLSVLGTNLYEPVVYEFTGKEQEAAEQQFVQIALMHSWKEQILNDGKITILLTDGARAKNWMDRDYDNKDVAFSQRWASEKKREVQEGKRKAGMCTILQAQEPQLFEKVSEISILDAKTEEEIWSVFETIYESIGEGDEIVFDITHSFRSIPLLAVTVMNYAKVLKNCSIKGIYYGAFEAAQVRDGVKYAPVIDLTVYNEILDWTNAAEAFMKYGIAAKMKAVYDEKIHRIRLESGQEVFRQRIDQWKPVKYKVDAMQNLAECIYTNRGTDAKEIKIGNAYRRSIKNAYMHLIENSTEQSKHIAREIKPLYPLMEKIESRYQEYFDKEKNYEIGLGVVKWSIDNHMIQQGYTALEETVKTYLCYRYNLDDKTEATRDDVIGRILTGINKIMNTKKASVQEFQSYREREPEKVLMEIRGRMDPKAVEKYDSLINEMIRTMPLQLVVLGSCVKELRNDISHMGFRISPQTAERLGSLLKTYYEEFLAFIQAESAWQDTPSETV